MRYVSWGFWILIIILAVIFAVLNSTTIQVHFYIASFHIYLPLLLFIDLVLGAILGMLALLPIVMRLKHTNWKLRQRIKQSEQEVKNLRTIPIKDSH